MAEKFLYEKLLTEFGKRGIDGIQLPEYITKNINPKFQIRTYQQEAFQRFICYHENDFEFKETPTQLLFNMATGSGKTLMMAGIILYLYNMGYRNFLFFVNSTNILEKTRDNFLNGNSSKYLFNENIIFNGREVLINAVSNFNANNEDDINIFFTTIQGLHSDLTGLIKENSISYNDFQDRNIVLLSDEAHHLNVSTRNSQSKSEKTNEKNWEETISEILKFSYKNILLEFTATIDWNNKDIKKKYTNKIVYRYDLIDFRKDKFSKEIKTLSLDSSLDQIMIHAVILSQYRLKIAEKHNIPLKPVILFKAQRTIAQSNENEEQFKRLIENLNIQQLETLLNINFEPIHNTIFVQAFSYLDKIYKENYQLLIDEIQQDFSNEKILNVNEDKIKEKNQILLNSLEDEHNPIRAIFAVNKLNEGWDVLNLFDIVRLYDTRDGQWLQDGKYKAGKTTLSEAQLIGRGARYYPFTTHEEHNKFTRKFDEEINNELKILEELHYHSKYNSRYLDELDKALIEQGLLDIQESVHKEIIKIVNTSKDSFYRTKFVFKNKQVVNFNKDKNSFADYNISHSFPYRVATDEIQESSVFENGRNNTADSPSAQRIQLKSIDRKIFYKAFNQNKDFWTFSNIQMYFGNLRSMDELLHEKYFYSMYIESNKAELSTQQKLDCINKLLASISKTLAKNASNKKGTEVFYSHYVHEIFKEVKELKFDARNTLFSTIDIEDIKDYFLHDKLVGTDEEKGFILFFKDYLEQLLLEYQEVKLLRNNRDLKIYRFSDGEAFEPDFILFLTKKNGEEISYQVFIEPKGDHLLKYEAEKEKFLKQIKERYKFEDILYEKDTYKLLGLRFYNRNREREFELEFKEELNLAEKMEN